MITPGIRNMLLAVLFFSLMNLGAKWLHGIPAHEIVLVRSVVSLIISVVTLQYLGIFSFGNNKPLLLLRGIFGSSALLLFFICIQEMSLASAITIQYLSPIFVAIFGIFILKEKVHPLQWLFFGLAFSGVVLISEFDSQIEPLYLIIGILSSALSGMAYTTIRMMKDTDHPLVVVMYFPLVSLPISIILCLAWSWVSPNATEWVVLILTGIAAQIGQAFMTNALHQEKANRVSSVNFLGILFGLLFGYVFFQEALGPWVVAGIFLVLAGVTANVVFRR
jgi:drug/metabolite transporter (DMT)-like permease